MFGPTKREVQKASFMTGMRRIFPFGRETQRKAAVAPAGPSVASGADSEKIRALGFFCGALTREDELYADAGAGAAAFAHCAHLSKHLRAELHGVFAKSCLDGGHVKHVRELDAFINKSSLADRDMALELTHALRIVLAREKHGAGFIYENGSERSIAIFKHLLSLVRRAPRVFATLAAPEGGVFDLRAIEHRLLDERLDHADSLKMAAPEPLTVSLETAEIARRIGLEEPYTPEAVQAARRAFAARWHPDRAPAHKREQANQALAAVNAALDEIAAKLAV